jgi:hypothetical protein
MSIYLPFAFFVGKWAGILALGIVGLVGFLLQPWWVGFISREFFKRKYIILQGFREK